MPPEEFDRHDLPDGGSWTATLESINARLDDAFYAVTCWQNDTPQRCIMVVVHALLDAGRIADELAGYARQGTGNTDYGGSSHWRKSRERQGLPLPDGRIDHYTWRGSPPTPRNDG